MCADHEPAVSCPVCHSSHWTDEDCGDTGHGVRSHYAICCECATAWDMATGDVLDRPGGTCAYMVRHRQPLTDEERHRFAGQFSLFFARLGMPLDQPGTKDTPLRFVDAMADITAGYDGAAVIRGLELAVGG